MADGRDGRVVADRREALVDGVDDLLAIDAVFQREADVVVGVGVRIDDSATKAKRLPVPGVRTTLTVGAFMTRLTVRASRRFAGIDLAGYERLHAGRRVGDVAQLDRRRNCRGLGFQ